MKTEALILALDGVMFDTEQANLMACNEAFERCGLSLRWSLQDLRAAIRLQGASAAVRVALKGENASRATIAALEAERHRSFLERISASPLAVHAACASLVHDAAVMGAKLAIVTDMPADMASALLDAAYGDDVTTLFATVVCAARFDAEPGNGPHSAALRTLGVEADDCIALDAAVPGLRAARQAGIWAVATTPYEKGVARISGADLWCPHLHEFRHLVDRNGLRKQQPDGHVTFDGLSASKNHQCKPANMLTVRVRAAA